LDQLRFCKSPAKVSLFAPVVWLEDRPHVRFFFAILRVSCPLHSNCTPRKSRLALTAPSRCLAISNFHNLAASPVHQIYTCFLLPLPSLVQYRHRMSMCFPTKESNLGGCAGCRSPTLSTSPSASSLSRSRSAAALSSASVSCVCLSANSDA